MMHPIMNEQIEANNTAPAAISLADFINGSFSKVTLSANLSMAEFINSNDITKVIHKIKKIHSVVETSKTIPNMTTRIDITN